MESIEISSNAVNLDSVISFTIDLINAGQTLAAWAAPHVLALEEYIGEAFDSHLGADPTDQAALADRCAIQMPILKDHPGLSPFDNLVGRLMVLAHLRCGRRIPALEYQQIAVAADQQGWKSLRHLEGNYRKKLAISNQQPGRPIHSFEQALAPKSKFRRAALRRFYRAYEKFRRMNPQLVRLKNADKFYFPGLEPVMNFR